MPTIEGNRIAVVGAGAVGCYFGGMLARAGVAVTLIGRAEHVEAIRRDGLLIDGLRVHEHVRVEASTELSAAGGAEIVLFCVKTTDTESAARSVLPYLGAGSVLISMQNGVDNVERIRAATGLNAVAAVVYVAAAMSGPGKVTHSGRGDLVSAQGPASAAVARMFERAEVPCRISEEIGVELWKKMLMNCAYNAVSALGRARYGVITRHEGARELMRGVIEEATAVARADGVELDADEMTEAAYQLGEAMSEATSSTAQDIGRCKVTEIDSLNGYVVRRGSERGIPVPVNRALWTLVKLLEY